MKIEVLAKFHDIHTKEVYEVGRVLDVTKKRYNEMVANLKKAKPGVEFVKETTETKDEAEG